MINLIQNVSGACQSEIWRQKKQKNQKIIPQSNPSPMVLSFFVHLMSKTSTFIAHTFQQFNSEHYNVQDTNALNHLCTKIQSDIFSPNWPLKWVIMSFAGRMSIYDVDDFSRTRYGVWRWKLLSYCVCWKGYLVVLFCWP